MHIPTIRKHLIVKWFLLMFKSYAATKCNFLIKMLKEKRSCFRRSRNLQIKLEWPISKIRKHHIVKLLSTYLSTLHWNGKKEFYNRSPIAGTKLQSHIPTIRIHLIMKWFLLIFKFYRATKCNFVIKMSKEKKLL